MSLQEDECKDIDFQSCISGIFYTIKINVQIRFMLFRFKYLFCGM